VSCYAAQVPDTRLTLCRLRATPERLTERVFRRGLGRGPVIPGPPPATSKQQLAAMAAEAVREARELDAATSPICASTRTTTTSLRSPSTYAHRPAAGLS
jgi:hypothetical protein